MSRKNRPAKFEVKRPAPRVETRVKELLNPSQFEEVVVRSERPSIIDFWAEWCGPCKAVAPAYAAVAEKLGDQVNFCKVNTEKSPTLAQQFNIRSIPTLITMFQGEVIDVHIGATQAAGIERMAQKAIAAASKMRPREARPEAPAGQGSGAGLVARLKGLFGASAA